MFSLSLFTERILFTILLLFVALCSIANPVSQLALNGLVNTWQLAEAGITKLGESLAILLYRVRLMVSGINAVAGSPVPQKNSMKRNYVAGRYVEPGWCN